MSIDSLTFLGESLLGPSVLTDDLLRRLDASGIERAIACPAKPRGYLFERANDMVAEAVRAHPDRLAGLVRVDPNLGSDAEAEAQRGLTELGLRGLFLHPWEESFRIRDERVEAVVEVARAHAAPVVVAAGYPWVSEGLQVGDLARCFPDVVFVATNGLQLNMSGLGQVDADLALADNANLLIQTTGVYREDFLQNVVATYGAQRVLFASALPHFDPSLELRRVEWGGFSDADQKAMLHDNAVRVFGR
jgi:predicted TIM-barrel fold metal-dependent hydrolase